MSKQAQPTRPPRRGAPQRGYKKYRVVYRVEKLPDEIRALVDRGLRQGKSYRDIQKEVEAAGETITHHAIGRYWRHCWQPQSRWLQWINAQAAALAQALRHTGESDEAVLARKLLFGQLLTRMEHAFKDVRFFDLLRESREMVKATRHLPSKAPSATEPPMSRAELRRRVREIYGWPKEEPEAEASEPGDADS